MNDPSSTTNKHHLIYDWNLVGDIPQYPSHVLVTDETLRDGLQSPSITHPDIQDKIYLLYLMRDLGIIKAKDTPEIETILIEVPDPVGGYGSKGMGEIGLVPTAAAVAGALHAYDGIWRNSLPMTESTAARSSVPKLRRKK